MENVCSILCPGAILARRVIRAWDYFPLMILIRANESYFSWQATLYPQVSVSTDTKRGILE